MESGRSPECVCYSWHELSHVKASNDPDSWQRQGLPLFQVLMLAIDWHKNSTYKGTKSSFLLLRHCMTTSPQLFSHREPYWDWLRSLLNSLLEHLHLKHSPSDPSFTMLSVCHSQSGFQDPAMQATWKQLWLQQISNADQQLATFR